ncbi:MAG: PBP1A family penicillin-binding protein [Candidatus Vogelbacteria bacterium]|nr:PBP1A family penicillin-binding protein [Candidatus Vogelbacteria bacterium]
MFKRFSLKEKIATLVSIALFSGGALFIWASTLPLPDFNNFFEERTVNQSTKIYDRTGTVLLYDIHGDVKRRVVPFDQIAPAIKQATIAIEDDQFYQHIGIRPLSIIRALIADLASGSLHQGGSTITQQVVKNTLLVQDKRWSRKIKELILSLKLERSMSKDDILSLYLNESPYGGNIYGVEEAVQNFFKKKASEVTLTEAAYLAALPQAPTYYSPFGNNFDKLEARKNIVLKRMKDLGYITIEQYNQALTEKVKFNQPEEKGIKAPHFVFYIKAYLEEKYGQEAVENQGFKVITTLDWDLQKKADAVVAKYGAENAQKYNAKNAGLVAIDPRSGQILTMVGSRDYFDTANQGNFNTVLAHRQPGSAFKPFVYATALIKGYTPNTVVFDLPTEFNTGCTPDGLPASSNIKPEECYMPVNYDNTYLGPISFRDALAQSRNIPAVKVLYLAGIKASIKTAQAMGITSLTDPSRYGLTLVLGGGEVTPLELTSAYGVFANNGVRYPPAGILKIEDLNGQVLEEYQEKPQTVISSDITSQISSILSDNVARTPAFSATSPMYFPGREVAAKTGTTNDYKDAWIVGYTPSIAVGAWVGNNDNSPMEKKVAGFIVAPMWNEFMNFYLAGAPNETFPIPPKINTKLKPVLRGIWQGNQIYTIDSVSKQLATPDTPEAARQDLAVYNIHSILYWVNKNDPTGPVPSNPSNDPQFNLWETPVRRFVAKQGIKENETSFIPTKYDPIHKPGIGPKLTIISPTPNSTIPITDTLLVNLQIESLFPIQETIIYINNQLVVSNKTSLTYFAIPLHSITTTKTNQLRVVVSDSIKNQTEQIVEFNLNE